MFRNGGLFRRQLKSVPKALSSGMPEGKNKEKLDICSLIPPRKKRTSTEVLKVLSYTVGRDPTAFHYQLPDDPFFYPTSNFQKKKRLMAMESGRKSARWIIENNPGFFNHNLAEPPIKTFLNKPVFDENSEVTEETLLGLIHDRSVTQAITIYKLLQNKGVDVSKETKLSLLELVCFYNSIERPDDEDLWGKWYEVNWKNKHVWQDDGFVKTLFDSLEPECPLAYAALIQGMLKHDNLEEAMELFEVGKEIKIKFPVDVYNLIIHNIPRLEKDPLKRFEVVENYLMQMSKEKIKPNLGTLNSVLNALARVDGVSLHELESFVCKLLVEFENLKIYPSLGSYCYILKIFTDQSKISRMRTRVAWSVMDSLRTKRWTIQHPSDFLFFQYAMSLFCTGLNNLRLATALVEFYSEYDHYKFVKTNFTESQFLDQYLYSVFTRESLERAMDVYRDLVPSKMFLDSRKYAIILKIIIQQKKFEYLGEIWKDLNQYLSNQFPKMSGTISLIISPVSFFKKEETPIFFYEAAEVLFKVLDTAELESKTLENMLITFVRFEDENKVSGLMDFIIERDLLFVRSAPLDETFAFALLKKNISLVKNCLELYYRGNDKKLDAVAKEAWPLLNEEDQSWVNAMLKKVVERNRPLTAGDPKINSEST